VTWTVVLANKKAAHTSFFRIMHYNERDPKRNADWPYDRSTLVAIKKETLSSGETFIVMELNLGKIILENSGSLLIIGGKGASGSIKDDAIVKITIDNDEPKEITNLEGKSWVLVAPPKYAPGILNLVPLYQVILETLHPIDPEHLIDPEVVFDLDNPVEEYPK
ncbi:1544_t:CDS:2, partial [Racocetra persica]